MICNDRDNRLFFDGRAAGWDATYDAERYQRIRFIFATHLSDLPTPLLDLGCGTGVLLPILKQHEGPLIEADLSQAMLRAAIDRHPLNGTHFIRSDGHFLPFRDDAFGSVVCFQVFPHFGDKMKVIAELRRVLRPEGRLVVLHLMGHRKLNALHARAGRAVENDHLPPVDVLAEKVCAAGFCVEKTIEQPDLYLLVARLQG